MILNSTKTAAAVPFKPVWRKDASLTPTFMLRAGSILERGAMEAELTGEHRAGIVYVFEERDVLTQGANACLAESPHLSRVLQLIQISGDEKEEAVLSDDDKELLDETRKGLAEVWKPYRDLRAQAARRNELMPIVALQRFCVDIRGEAITFSREPDGRIADATFAGLASFDIMLAGREAYSMQYGRGDQGKSQPGSPSAEGQTSTGSDETTDTVAGSSKASRGRKTRSSS